MSVELTSFSTKSKSTTINLVGIDSKTSDCKQYWFRTCTISVLFTSFIIVTFVSIVISAVWAVLTFNSDVYGPWPGALMSGIISVGLITMSYFILFCVALPNLACMIRNKEDPDCCTRSFYRAFFISASLGLIGTFAAGFSQVFVAGQFVDDVIDMNSNGAIDSDITNSRSTDTFNTLGLVAASTNLLAALVSIISIILMAFIVNQNPWRRCGHDAHCINACLLYTVLLIGVSIAFFLIVEGTYLEILTTKSPNASQYNNLPLTSILAGVFLVFLFICGCIGIPVLMNGLKSINVVKIIWFFFGAVGCVAGGSLLIQSSYDAIQYYFPISTFTYSLGILCFIIAATSCLTSCTTCVYWCIRHQELQGRRGRGLTTYSFAIFRSGKVRPATEAEFNIVSAKFTTAWKKGNPPTVSFIYVINNRDLSYKYNAYKKKIRAEEDEQYFHGSKLICNITANETLCRNTHCGICNISSIGMDRQHIQKNIDFQRFGPGFYLAPHSSKCHDYTLGAHTYRAMFLCDVCPGKKYELRTTDRKLRRPPNGYNSIYGQVGQDLNYPEIVLHNPDAILPRYIIVYQKDGEGNLLN